MAGELTTLGLARRMGIVAGPDAGVGVVYEPETDALVARFTTPPTTQRKGLINDLIKSLKAASVWTKLDALWLTAAADSQAARQNWLADQYNLSAVSGPTFTPDRGYNGDGSASYLDTGFNPATAAGKFIEDNAHLGVWPNTNVNEDRDDIGNANNCIRSRTSGGASTAGRVNQASTTLNAGAVTTSVGHTIFSRSSASGFEAFKNGISLGVNPVASNGPNSSTILLCSGRVAGFSSKRIASAHLGQALSLAEALAAYNAINTYLTAVGAT